VPLLAVRCGGDDLRGPGRWAWAPPGRSLFGLLDRFGRGRGGRLHGGGGELPGSLVESRIVQPLAGAAPAMPGPGYQGRVDEFLRFRCDVRAEIAPMLEVALAASGRGRPPSWSGLVLRRRRSRCGGPSRSCPIWSAAPSLG
jgi:hypothetical protein